MTRRRARGLLAATALASVAGGNAAAECPAPGDDYARLAAGPYTAWIAPVPRRLAVGTEFALEARVCAEGGARIDAVRFDAWMPEHRHGMNLRPSARAMPDGRWRAEGFLLHMPGRWEFVVEIDAPRGRARLVHAVTVE